MNVHVTDYGDRTGQDKALEIYWRRYCIRYGFVETEFLFPVYHRIGGKGNAAAMLEMEYNFR